MTRPTCQRCRTVIVDAQATFSHDGPVLIKHECVRCGWIYVGSIRPSDVVVPASRRYRIDAEEPSSGDFLPQTAGRPSVGRPAFSNSELACGPSEPRLHASPGRRQESRASINPSALDAV